MSYDIKIQNKCDHLINWEQSDLEEDLKTIKLVHPVGSVYSLVLRINNIVVNQKEYSVGAQNGTFVDVPSSKIVMNKKVHIYEPLIEVRYTTIQKYCPKCYGIKVIDDIKYNPSGDWGVVNKESLLIQNIEKIIVTKISSNSFHDWYGTGLHSLTGRKISDIDLLRSKVIESISSAINRFKNVQGQMLASGRKVDPGEILDEIISIELEYADDPCIILVVVVFTAQSGNKLEFSQFLELSNPMERVAFT